MQAIIMAGGEGTRLRPLTCNIPKPLAELCGRPVLEYILELLEKHGFKKATLTLMYQGEKIVSHFDEDSFKGINLEYSFEDVPLGTAGSVKLAANEDEVLIISGDAMCDFNLTKAIEFHRCRNADATLIVKKVDDPREFGLVLYEKNGRITGFIEKPSYESCTTDMANTGVYILSKTALDLISKNKKTDFAQDIFPIMLNNKMGLYAYEEDGYWCDIGDFKTYVKCQHDMLLGKVNCVIDVNGSISTHSTGEFRGVRINTPCFIGQNISIGEGTVIEAGSVICDNVTIGKDCIINAGIILEGAYLGNRVSLSNAIICKNAKLLSGCSASEYSVIGERAVIGENSVIEAGVKIWESKQLEINTVATADVRFGDAKRLALDEDGLCGETNAIITPQLATTLGNSVGSCLNKNNNVVAVGHNGENSSKCMVNAFITGVLASGGDAWDFGECSEAELAFCMQQCQIMLGCYVESAENTKLKILSENGLNPTRKEERKIESGLARSDYNKVAHDDFGEYKDVSAIKNLYTKALSSQLPDDLKGVCAVFKTPSNRISHIINESVGDKIDAYGERIVFSISADGKKASAYNESIGYIPYEMLVILGCKIFFSEGKDVSLPYSFPLIADDIAKQYNKTVYRYYNCSFDGSDEQARKKASDSSFVNDGAILAILIIRYLLKNEISLFKAIQDIPRFYYTSRYISVENPSKALKNISTQKAGLGEGVALNENKSRVLIRPIKSGKGVRIFVESFKSETAVELCDKFEKLLKDKNQ